MVISQHVCEHENYRRCVIEIGKCIHCGWLTPELEAEAKEIRYEKEDLVESKIKRKDPCDSAVQACDHYDDGEMANTLNTSTGPTGFGWLDSNWIKFWLRLELLYSNLKATSKKEYFKHQKMINECMKIETLAVVTPAENDYRPCRRYGDCQWQE